MAALGFLARSTMFPSSELFGQKVLASSQKVFQCLISEGVFRNVLLHRIARIIALHTNTHARAFMVCLIDCSAVRLAFAYAKWMMMAFLHSCRRTCARVQAKKVGCVCTTRRKVYVLSSCGQFYNCRFDANQIARKCEPVFLMCCPRLDHRLSSL